MWLDLFIEKDLFIPVPNDHTLGILAEASVLAQLQVLGHRDHTIHAKNRSIHVNQYSFIAKKNDKYE